MLLPAVCSLIYREDDLWVFLASALFTSTFGMVLEGITKVADKPEELERKDGFFIASMCWFTASIFGALP